MAPRSRPPLGNTVSKPGMPNGSPSLKEEAAPAFEASSDSAQEGSVEGVASCMWRRGDICIPVFWCNIQSFVFLASRRALERNLLGIRRRSGDNRHIVPAVVAGAVYQGTFKESRDSGLT